jgi:hypothetical protein
LTLDELIYFATDTLVTRQAVDPAPPPLPDEITEKLPAINDKLNKLAEGHTEVEARTALSEFLANATDELAKKARIAVGVAPWQFALDGNGKVKTVTYERVATLDLSQPYTSTPPSLAATEAYIDELIRVWRNITSEMEGGPLTVQPQHANGPGVVLRTT